MKKNHNNSYNHPYDSRNKLQMGEYRGVGIPVKFGTHKHQQARLEKRGMTKQVPPLKFN